MRITLILIVAVIALVTAISGMYVVFSIPSKDYALDVDALKDEQSLFINARVILTNTGRLPLTNVNVDYGNTQEMLSIIRPGEKVHLSPPEGSRLDFVSVSSDEGIKITKEYRKPFKLPGMIGS